MLRPRIIPCLLVHNKGLVKTVRFATPKYVGDPINAVKIFNEKEVDELIVLDIDATVQARDPDYTLIRNVASECRMPLCYGGGIRSVEHAVSIIKLGVEKVAIGAASVEDPEIVTGIARAVGRQSVAVVLDAREAGKSGKYEVWTRNGTRNSKRDPVSLAREAVERGAGEITLNCIDRDGMMTGYDLDLAERIRAAVNVPMTVLGGAGKHSDIEALLARIGIAGAAAGSLFVFKGVYKAVLISYPERNVKEAFTRAAVAGAAS